MTSEFCGSTRLRQFEIKMAGGSLFINSYWMAEISPYFAQVCFEESFSEAKLGHVYLEGVEYCDVLAMLEYCCPDKHHMLTRTINDSNLAALIHCANRFQVPTLQHDIEQFLDKDLMNETVSLKAESLVDAIIEAKSANYKPSLLRPLYQRLADHGIESIKEAVKDFPSEISSIILQEVASYIQVLPTPMLRSSYNWNHRVFF